MSILHNTREFKKEAKITPIAQLNEILSAIQEVIADRQKEEELVKVLEGVAKEHGFSLEKLGYVRSGASSPVTAGDSDNKRLRKPKFKSLNADSQYFYTDENNVFQLLRTHTMKKQLESRNITIIPYGQLEESQKSEAQRLIDDAITFARDSYNSKVDAWNEYARENDLEVLSKK